VAVADDPGGRGRSSLGTAGRSADRRLSAAAATAVVVPALVAINIGEHVLSAPWWVKPVEAAVLLGFARFSGSTWTELGLGRDRMASGCRWGLGAVAAVAGVYAVGVLLPATRPAFQDSRYHLPVEQALVTALVVIPLGTVVLEEIAFRSVLWSVLARRLPTRWVLLTTSALFGLWHLLPAIQAADRGASAPAGGVPGVLVVAGTLVVTTAGGLVFGLMRYRSGSVLASAGAHWATNALGVLFGLVAWRLAG
jgi:uncharacterized protein